MNGRIPTPDSFLEKGISFVVCYIIMITHGFYRLLQVSLILVVLHCQDKNYLLSDKIHSCIEYSAFDAQQPGHQYNRDPFHCYLVLNH